MEQHAQIMIAQRFVTITAQHGFDLSKALLDFTSSSRDQMMKQGIPAEVFVRQVIITGTIELKVTIIMDVMQVVKFGDPPEEQDKTKSKELPKTLNGKKIIYNN